MREATLQSIYLALIGESVSRLDAASVFLDEYASRAEVSRLEAAILQVRKALELFALAAIAPDKNAYAAFRATADKDPDYTKDYHAAKIFGALSRVNADFYPKPLTPAERQPDGSWHYGEKQSGFLSKKRFERAYDRLGKHLHAYNPWDGNKNLQNLVSDIPKVISEARSLLQLHARFIRTREFHGVWVIRADTPRPEIITALAQGPYVL
jgi:hypothetical protein